MNFCLTIKIKSLPPLNPLILKQSSFPCTWISWSTHIASCIFYLMRAWNLFCVSFVFVAVMLEWSHRIARTFFMSKLIRRKNNENPFKHVIIPIFSGNYDTRETVFFSQWHRVYLIVKTWLAVYTKGVRFSTYMKTDSILAGNYTIYIHTFTIILHKDINFYYRFECEWMCGMLLVGLYQTKPTKRYILYSLPASSN